MYITSVKIRDVRSIASLEWQIEPERAPGWHVLIGDNGSGKSTVLRSIALALIGDSGAEALQQDWDTYLRYQTKVGVINLEVQRDRVHDQFVDVGFSPAQTRWTASIELALEKNRKVRLKNLPPNSDGDVRDFHDSVWQQKSGWFSASYGPFRRFTGGARDEDRLIDTRPASGRHMTLFRENIALTESIRWLESLQFKKLEEEPEGDLLDSIKEFVNQKGFLPNNTRLQRISSRGVQFVDGNGNHVLLDDLSDGYRSILSLTFELIRQLALTYGSLQVFDKKDPTRIHSTGVVLIDEIDVHLHPTWQRQVGSWFRDHFPKLQFIVTSHSPFVCQASTMGTVYCLPTPGTEDEGRMVSGLELQRLLYGNILEAYGTELFGDAMTRSEESFRHLKRLASLNVKDLRGQLTARERREQYSLREVLPTQANTLDVETTANR